MLYEIRKAEIKDLPEVYRLICLLEETDLTFAVFKSFFEANIKNPDCYYLVAGNKETIIGFISCHVQKLLHHCGKVAEIQEMFVDQRYRQLGIGKQLIETMETILKSASCVSLEVTANNKRLDAHKFYENAGFIHSHIKFVKQLKA